MINALKIGIAFTLVAFVSCIIFLVGRSAGITEGLDKFHEACYTGGIVINEKTGKVIRCEPLGMVPKEEIPGLFQQPLDKDAKVV